MADSFLNENVLQAESGLTPATAAPSLSLRCPHCNHIGTFSSLGNTFTYNKKNAVPKNTIGDLLAAIRICPNNDCKGLVLSVEFGDGQKFILPPESVPIDTKNLPPACVRTLVEAAACHATGAYRASAMMIRRLLEEICELNSATGSNLHERLDSLKTKIVLPHSLFIAMAELKALGNDAAHIETKIYDAIGKDESEDSISLACEILKSLYQLNSLVARLQARKKLTPIS